jgi:hypothetical protein
MSGLQSIPQSQSKGNRQIAPIPTPPGEPIAQPPSSPSPPVDDPDDAPEPLLDPWPEPPLPVEVPARPPVELVPVAAAVPFVELLEVEPVLLVQAARLRASKKTKLICMPFRSISKRGELYAQIKRRSQAAYFFTSKL